MAKSTNKSIDTEQELVLMRQSIRLIRERVNVELDAIDEQIKKLLPPADTERTRRMKKYTKKEWSNFLTF